MSDENGAIALARAVHTALQNNILVQTILGQQPRLYDHAPEDPIYPYLSYGGIKTENQSGDEAPLFKHTMSLHLWSRYCGRSEILHLTSAVCKALEAENLVLGNHNLISANIVFTDIFRASDAQSLHGLIRLIAITQPQ